jgi:hypothetical protein
MIEFFASIHRNLVALVRLGRARQDTAWSEHSQLTSAVGYCIASKITRLCLVFECLGFFVVEACLVLCSTTDDSVVWP